MSNTSLPPQKDATFVFLLHGFTGSSNDWNEIIPQSQQKVFLCCIDLIGHGKSDSPKIRTLHSRFYHSAA